MSDFLSRAQCNGRRPLKFASCRHYARPHLLAKLLRERNVARFIVAPDGFGKTAIALEYAETVFDFEHVFWIDATSPCFLRDLDKGILAQTLLEKDTESFLVVVEDIPLLDAARVEVFSQAVDGFLARDCEVLVTCTPVCDAFSCQTDRIRLGAEDLLLFDAELDINRTSGECSSHPASLVPMARRVSVFAWGAEADRVQFLKSLNRDDLPADVRIGIFVMFVLQKGQLGEVSDIFHLDKEATTFLMGQYSYLGIDRMKERFETIPLSVDEIASVFHSKLPLLVCAPDFPDSDTLVTSLANSLVSSGSFARACEVARLLMGRQARTCWLVEHDFILMENMCLMPACKTYGSLRGKHFEDRYKVDTGEACRRSLLGDRRAACVAARRVVQSSDAGSAWKAIAALVLSESTLDPEATKAAELAYSCAQKAISEGAGNLDSHPFSLESLSACSDVSLLLKKSPQEAMKKWLLWYSDGVQDELMIQVGMHLLSHAEVLRGEGAEGFVRTYDEGRVLVEELAICLCARIQSLDEESFNVYFGAAGTMLEQWRSRGIVSIPEFEASTLYVIGALEAALVAQQTLCMHDGREQVSLRKTFLATHPDVFRKDEKLPPSVLTGTQAPSLTVNLFGGLEVFIGEARVHPSMFKRQKVKTLLALLVLNRGREFSRDKLVSLLWPDSDLEAARRNFYSIWSLLRNALTIPGGHCPYLIRQQRGLRIDATLLSSDIFKFDEVCQILLFESPHYGGWNELSAQINNVFMDELLPSEVENNAIEEFRMDNKNKLVDALLAASTRLVLAGETQEGLWFAQAAYQCDGAREDTFTSLMRAQMVAGQRTSALDTYFSCQNFLSSELGIDPSPEIISLYQKVINAEEFVG